MAWRLAKADLFCPDVILLDIGLPGMNGYEVARRLSTDRCPKRPRLVALTGYGQDEDRQMSAESGFHEHFTKPVDLERLLQVLQEIPGTQDQG